MEAALQKENVTLTILEGLKVHLGLKVTGPEDTENYQLVKNARILCRDLRVLAVKLAKAGREDALKEQKAWIAEEKRVVGEISVVEEYLIAQEQIVDGPKEAAKKEAEAKAEQEKIDAEKRTRDKVVGRLNALFAVGVPKTFEEISAMPDSDYDQLLTTSKKTFDDATAAKKKAQDEIDAENAETAKRLAQQKADQDKKDAELKAEQKKLDEAKAAAEKEKQDAAAKVEADRKAAAEKERLEALKPEKEKLASYAEALLAVPMPELVQPETVQCLSEARSFVKQATTILTK